MSIQSSPPYLSTSLVWPRQLNRWLDINAQNGALQRTQTYITLPSFNYNNVWLGYSNLIASFNFEGPNNFSLTSLLGEIPTNPNYLLCIMWRDSQGNTYRYTIWNNVGEVMYIPCPLYTGQLIKKNFRFEIWSIASSGIQSQTTPINFYTSKRGIQDYMWGNDSLLISADLPCTNFSVDAINPSVTLPTAMGPVFDAEPGGINYTNWPNFISWTDDIAHLPLNLTGTAYLDSILPQGGNTLRLANNASYFSVATPNWGIQSMVFVCKITNITGNPQKFLFSAYPNGIALFWNNGTITVGGAGPSVIGLSYGVWYTFVFTLIGGNSKLYVFDLLTGALLVSNLNLAPIVGYTNAIGLGNAEMSIAEAILGINSIADIDAQAIANYASGRYAASIMFDLPFIWPVNSYPTVN